MKAIHLIAPATIALSAAFHSARLGEAAHNVIPISRASRVPDKRRAVLVRTELVSSARVRRILGCDDCGNLFSQYVTVLVLRDVLSDGTARRRFHTLGA